MWPNRRTWIGAGLICVALAGCGKPTDRLNAPPQGQAEHCSRMRPIFTYMTDNEMLSDMCIADIHFVPNTTELNSLGTTRLSRMAQLLEPYGGTVRYATDSSDEELVNKRLEHVCDFLASAGADLDRIDVIVAMAAAGHAQAAEAIEAKAKGMSPELDESTGTEGQ